MTISKDFETAIEHLEMLRRNFQRISEAYPSHLEPENRYAKGHHAGYIAALSAAIELISHTAEMQAKYEALSMTPPAMSKDNVIDLLEALRKTETQTEA